MKKHFNFTLILESVSVILETLEDALYRAGCDDALLWTRNGSVYIDFTREANSMRDAVTSAIENIEGSPIGLRVGGIAPAPLVTQAMIAERLGVSREAVRLWIEGKRGKGMFPTPVTTSGKGTAYWDWVTILQWRKTEGDEVSPEEIESAETLFRISMALILSRHGKAVGDARSVTLPT